MKNKSWMDHLTKDERLEYDHEMAVIEKEMFLKGRQNDLNRGRSITVGKVNEAVEVTIRTVGGISAFHILNQDETIELIHQLAANVGCHINIKPREDFASYRIWNEGGNTQQLQNFLLEKVDDKATALKLLHKMIEDNNLSSDQEPTAIENKQTEKDKENG